MLKAMTITIPFSPETNYQLMKTIHKKCCQELLIGTVCLVESMKVIKILLEKNWMNQPFNTV